MCNAIVGRAEVLREFAKDATSIREGQAWGEATVKQLVPIGTLVKISKLRSMEGSSDMYCVVRMIVNYFDQTQNHISRLIYGLDLGKSNDVTCLLEHGMNFPYGELVNDFNYWDKDYPVIEVLQLDYVQCLIPSEMAKQILSPMLPLEITKLVQQYLLRAI